MDEQEIEDFLKMEPVVITLSPADFKFFIETCMNPPAPTEGLKKLLRSDLAVQNWKRS